MTKREFIGGLTIVVLLFLIFMGVHRCFQQRSREDARAVAPDIDEEIIVKHETAEEYKAREYNPESSPGYRENEPYSVDFRLHTFDPNTVGVSDMKKMGFPENLIRNIENYRRSGGVFYDAADMQKLYSMRREWFGKMTPYIQISKTANTKKATSKPKHNKYKKKSYPPLDLNTATVEQLDQQWGVSPKVASNIVKFREKLGGFYALEQVREVYTLPDSVYEHNKNIWYIEKPELRKINVNTASYEELNQQSYIRKYKYAKLIVNYRKKHGKFRRLDELQKIRGIEPKALEKIKPYLTL